MAFFQGSGWAPGATVTVQAQDAFGNATGPNVGPGGTADANGAVTLTGLAASSAYVATDGTRTVRFRTPATVAPSPVAFPMRSGLYYPTYPSGSSTTTATLGNGTLRLAPMWIPAALTIARLAAEITAAGEAGSKLRLGIYADDGTGYPGALLLDAGQIAGDSATAQELTTSLSLQPGLYWAGAVVQSAPTTQPTVRAISQGPGAPVGNTALLSAGAAYLAYSQSGVTAALPATFTATVAPTGACARTQVKIA